MYKKKLIWIIIYIEIVNKMTFQTSTFTAFIGSQYNHQQGTCYFLTESDGNRLEMLLHSDNYIISRPKRTDDWDYGSTYHVVTSNNEFVEGNQVVIEQRLPINDD